MGVFENATEVIAALQATERVLMSNLGKARAERAEMERFIELYRLLDVPEELRPSAADVQAEATPPAVVTPAPAESVTAEGVARDASSAPSQAKASEDNAITAAAEPGIDGTGDVSRPSVGGGTDALIPPQAETPEPLDVNPSGTPIPAAATREDAGLAAPEPISRAGHIGSWVRTDDQTEIDADNEEQVLVEVLAREKAADAPPAGEVMPVTSPAPKPVADRILDLQATNPEITAKQLAEALGISVEHINAAAKKRGISIHRERVRGADSFAGKVAAAHAEHPKWTVRQLADHLGVAYEKVAGAARDRDLPVRKLTEDELHNARRHGGKNGGRAPKAKPAEAASLPPAPPPVVDRPVDDAEADFVPPRTVDDPVRIKKPSGQQFRLRTGRGEGKYLHMSCVGLVPGKSYAWIGNEKQMAAMRLKFPDTADLYEEPVEKEPARV